MTAQPTSTSPRDSAEPSTWAIHWDLETWDGPNTPGPVIRDPQATSVRQYGGYVIVAAPDRESAEKMAEWDDESLIDVDFLIPARDPGSMGHSPAWVRCQPETFDEETLLAIGYGRCHIFPFAVEPAEFVEAFEDGKREILSDIAAGNVPETVADFSELHDYVDANTYAGLCGADAEQGVPDRTDWSIEAANEIQGRLDRWLRERAVRLGLGSAAQTYLRVQFDNELTDDGEIADMLREMSGVLYVEVVGEVPSS